MIRRIAVIGPESTGKSEICQHLARIYETEWVPEFARFYLDRLGRPYEQEDLLQIAQGQMIWEDDKADQAEEYLFCDTNMIVMKIWSDHKYGTTDSWIEQELASRKYDFYLLANIDLIWRPDPQREHPKHRKHFFEIYENYLKEHQMPYGIVSGIEDLRIACAQKLLREFFKD
ncbi:MAG: NadR type nicotinamide-nucleotide adenylyltransferase [Marinoscillum sp.]|jgi:NadR type nicotinamide-nucleotide adenylyltransferase